MAKINMTDVREFGVRSLHKIYLVASKHSICVKRLNVVECTRRYSVYEDLVRKSQKVFNVQVYRNQSCIDEGIYVSGRENFVDEYIKWIKMLITRIEKDTEQNGNPPHLWSKVHGNTAYSAHAHKLVRRVLEIVFELSEYRDKICSTVLWWNCIKDYELTQVHCSELTILRNKTKYNGELRHTVQKPNRGKK